VIVVTPPTLDDDLSLTQRVEDLAVEEFVAQPRIEALDIAVLPGTGPLDIGGLCTDSRDGIASVLVVQKRPDGSIDVS
jgi:hypothetical protein